MKAKRLLAGLVAVAMTMGMMSSLVLADESENAPEETSAVETTEPKEKEAKEPEENKPSESSKEADSSESEDKKSAETTAPTESKKEEPSEPDETEPATTAAPAVGGKEDGHAVPPKNEQVPSTEITSVKITLDAPVIGAKPDYTAEFPTEANYYSESFSNEYYQNYICWLDVSANSHMYKASAVFEADHEYQVILFLTAKNGFSFTAGTTAKVNGDNAKTSIDEDGRLRVTYNFPKLQLKKITSVEVRIDVPVAGSKPDYDLDFPSGALYYSENNNNQIYRNDIRWQDKTDNNKILDPDSAVFETGHEYDVYIYLTAKAGYKFSENTKCTLNGNEATLNFLNGNGDTLGIVYTFKTVLTEISSVSVTLNAPVAGAKPEYTAVLPSGANCYVETQATGTYVRNGIKWRDMSTSTDLDPDSDELDTCMKFLSTCQQRTIILFQII